MNKLPFIVDFIGLAAATWALGFYGILAYRGLQALIRKLWS